LPLRFGTPRRFEEHELRRLSPAAQIHRALVAVDESGDALGIWGLVQSGPRWLQAAQGGRAKEPSMPPCLVVRIVRPGHLLIGCGTESSPNYVAGDSPTSRWTSSSLDGCPSVFREARAAMANEHRASARVVLDERVAADLTGHLAQQMVKRIAATMRSSIMAAPSSSALPTASRNVTFRRSYTFFDSTPRRRFRSLVLSILEAVAEHAAAVGRAATVDLYRAITDPRIAELDEGLFEFGHLIASLAAVDGAVVMTKRFEILGFGAEIAGSLPPVTEVRRAVDLEADTFVTELVDSVGTRHRSAYRFC